VHVWFTVEIVAMRVPMQIQRIKAKAKVHDPLTELLLPQKSFCIRFPRKRGALAPPHFLKFIKFVNKILYFGILFYLYLYN